jgi:hypothetical protein
MCIGTRSIKFVSQSGLISAPATRVGFVMYEEAGPPHNKQLHRSEHHHYVPGSEHEQAKQCTVSSK